MAADELKSAEQRGYSKGYAAGKKVAIAAAKDIRIAQEVERRMRFAQIHMRHSVVDFHAPDGGTLSLLLPRDLTADRLAYFRSLIDPYFDLLAIRLAEKERP